MPSRFSFDIDALKEQGIVANSFSGGYFQKDKFSWVAEIFMADTNEHRTIKATTEHQLRRDLIKLDRSVKFPEASSSMLAERDERLRKAGADFQVGRSGRPISSGPNIKEQVENAKAAMVAAGQSPRQLKEARQSKSSYNPQDPEQEKIGEEFERTELDAWLLTANGRRFASSEFGMSQWNCYQLIDAARFLSNGNPASAYAFDKAFKQLVEHGNIFESTAPLIRGQNRLAPTSFRSAFNLPARPKAAEPEPTPEEKKQAAQEKAEEERELREYAKTPEGFADLQKHVRGGFRPDKNNRRWIS